MAGPIQRFDFVESVFWQDLDVSPELYDYAKNYPVDRIDHAETSFHLPQDERLYKLTLACVDKFFIAVGKQLQKSGMEVLRMWVQKYDRGAYHPVHVHVSDQFHYSFVFYVDCTDNSGSTAFYNLGYPYVDHQSFKMKPKKGCCVLFPGAMPHEATPNDDNRRVIVSGNLMYVDRPGAART